MQTIDFVATSATEDCVTASDNGGNNFKVIAIKSGKTANGDFIAPDVLARAVSKFNGLTVRVTTDASHLYGSGVYERNIENHIGVLDQAKYVEKGKGAHIEARMQPYNNNKDIIVSMRTAIKLGYPKKFQFSVISKVLVDTSSSDPFDHLGTSKTKTRVVKDIISLTYLDLIEKAAAGGQLVGFTLAEKDTAMADNQDTATPAENVDLQQEIKAAQDAKAEAEQRAAKAEADLKVANDAANEQARLAKIKDDINASNLPDAAKQKLIAAAQNDAEFNAEQTIKDEQVYIDSINKPSSPVRGMRQAIVITEEQQDKWENMLYDFFTASEKPGTVHSIRKAYTLITGDSDCHSLGATPLGTETSMRLAQTSDFPLLFSNAMHKALIATYRIEDKFGIWKKLITAPTPLSDFKENKRISMGGFGDIPTVAELAPYTEFSNPPEQQAKYVPVKKGKTYSVSMELIRNDDVGAVRRIPIEMAYAAKQTLGKSVLDHMRANGAIYDNVALAHNNHNNLLGTALSEAAVGSGSLKMAIQTRPGSGERMDLDAKYLWVPRNLLETALNIFKRQTNNDLTYIQGMAIEICPVWYWTDADDWVLTCDPAQFPIMEVGFLDGITEPQLFIQNDPTTGSVFTHDKITYKIRHIYGSAVLDYRGYVKSQV